jgi:hypothetical protein
VTVDVTLAESYEKLSKKYHIHIFDTHATADANIDRSSIIVDAINKLNYKNLLEISFILLKSLPQTNKPN